MKVKDLQRFVFDKVSIYKWENGESENGLDDFAKDLYVGELKDAPNNILELEVRNIGAKRKSWIDICVR